MAQDEQKTDRVNKVAKSLESSFNKSRMKLAKAIAAAEDGHVIEQSERVIYDELNRLKTKAQEIGTQERIQEFESDFFPSGASKKSSQ